MSDGRRSVHYDPEEAIAALTDADPKLGDLIRRAGPFTMRLKSQHSPFEALVESIIYQQIHGKAAFAILSRLLHAFGDIHPQPDHILAAPEEMLRACGLSANKLKALRDLAAKTLDGTVPTLSRIRRMTRCRNRRTADPGARRRRHGRWRCCSSSGWAGRMFFPSATTACARAFC